MGSPSNEDVVRRYMEAHRVHDYDTVGTLRDPFGHKWAIATHLRDMTSEELEAAMKEPNAT